MSQEDKVVEQLKTQQQEAISYLYDRYGDALFGVILQIVRSKELAEQVLQDSFIKVWKNSGSYDRTKGRLFTWLLNISRNTAIDATRTAYFKHYQQTDDLTSLYATPAESNIHPDQVGLKELVGGLDEKYRILIELIYFKGYTQQEIEEELGIPLGTIKTRLRYALTELRKTFSSGNRSHLLLLILALEQFDHHLNS